MGYLSLIAPLLIGLAIQVNTLSTPITSAPEAPVAQAEEVPEEPSPTEAVAEEPPAPPQSNEDIVRIYTVSAWGEHEWPSMRQLLIEESCTKKRGCFDNLSQNPTSTAYGMFQFLDSTWARYGAAKTSDPIQQTEAGIRYIKARYGTPTEALRFHKANNWY